MFFWNVLIFKTISRMKWTADLKWVQPVVGTMQTPTFQWTAMFKQGWTF